MSCCGHCEDAGDLFGKWTARRDLWRYRRKGGDPATRQLIRMLKDEARREELEGGTLLDIGGGVGAIQHALIRSGVSRAVHVDASAAYLKACMEEARRQGHEERVAYYFGDFVALADQLPDADVVTLDRVICCYPDMPRLVAAAAAKARRLYGVSYPRDRWVTRAMQAGGNLFLRLRGSDFRTYMHEPDDIRTEIRRQGFERAAEDQNFLWHIEVWRRDGVRAVETVA